MKNSVQIFVTGTRGIPNIPGGIETHCQELYPLIAYKNYTILISGRQKYLKSNQTEWQKVKIIPVYSPSHENIEAIVHTFFSILKAWSLKVDLIHIHAVGPALLVPFAKLLRLKVIFTNHGQDYKKKKWGKIAKWLLWCGEYLGCLFSDGVIVISKDIKKIVQNRVSRKYFLIHNGVTFPTLSKKNDFLHLLNLRPKEYLLTVARFVPEKGLDLLVKAFRMIKTKYRLVIVGDTNYDTKYANYLKKIIDNDDRIIRTGYITGEPLNQIYSHSKLFILPSYNEGLPIVLLEAMSYHLSILASDIPAHLEINLSKGRYFKCGNILDLKGKIKHFLKNDISVSEKEDYSYRIKKDYNWETIAEQTINVYKRVLSKK